MDDEEMILNTTSKMLEKLGCQVELAKKGEDAIKWYTQALSQNSPHDLVIVYLTIPNGMGGKQTFTQLQELKPSVKCIVSSGYFKDPIIAKFSEYGFIGALQKPYSFHRLTELLSSIYKK